MKTMLTIPEEILLLTIERSGDPMVYNQKAMNVILSNALLMELLLENKVVLDEENNIIIADNGVSDNSYIEKAYQVIKQAHTFFTIDYWALEMLEYKDSLRKSLYESLKSKNIIEETAKRVFGIVYSKKYPVVDEKEYLDAKMRIRAAVLEDKTEEMRDVFILSLLYHGNMLQLIFSVEEIEKYNNKILSMLEKDFVGNIIDVEFRKETLFLLVDKMKVLFGSGNPREELEAYTKELKEKFGYTSDAQLPEWLRPGTEQYYKTLEYVDLEGTGYILYNKERGLYEPLQYVNNRRLN